MLAAALALGVLAACSDPAEPADPDPDRPSTAPSSTATAPDVPAEQVRTALGSIDPCSLLVPASPGEAGPGYAEGPHTCAADLGDVRMRVRVGVPYDTASRAASEQRTVEGLTAYADPDRCRLVFGAGPGHGIAIEVDERCDALPRAAGVVGRALADVDRHLRSPGPDEHSACALMAGAVDDPATLVDTSGGSSQGLDHCEITTGPATSRNELSLQYAEVRFTDLARRLGGNRVRIAGRDAVLVRGDGTCYLHSYLWPTRAEGRGRAHTEAVLSAGTCAEARSVAREVVAASATEPDRPRPVADLLTRGG
ncbi:hypothetical protein [Nocardioides albidus]|uniref:hypothetical protein n=1 Tax=Nocardioides albidus TaxID=1517589 RepID=UPI001118DD8D|nr:hypothetical protein [Nocardioides albidus]